MPASTHDTVQAVRAGEALDLDNLLSWLQQQRPDLTDTPKVSQYSGGVSNWTYCLSFNSTEIVLRRGPDGTKAKGAHDMQREYNLQRELKPVFKPVPQVYAYCADKTLIGSDF